MAKCISCNQCLHELIKSYIQLIIISFYFIKILIPIESQLHLIVLSYIVTAAKMQSCLRKILRPIAVRRKSKIIGYACH